MAAAPALSLCLIVRNEEEMLPGLLASVDGLWDELVVADTGSTDGTLDLLASAGARIVHHTWQDDFAAARNAGLEAARGRWIMVLDADERVTPGLIDDVRRLLDDPDAGAATLVMRNEMPDGQRRDADLLRLFRNDPAIRYEHAIHEDVSRTVMAHLQREGRHLRHLPGVVEHLGYVREVAAARDKKQRDLTLLQRLVADDPDDLYSWYKILELARFWDDEDLARTTAPAVAPILDRAAPEDLGRRLWSGDLAVLVAASLYQDPADALAWLDDRRDRVHPSAAWHLARGHWLEALGKLAEADEAFTVCAAACEEPGATAAAVRPLLGRARLAVAAGDLAKAHALAREAAADAPRDAEALLAAVTFSRLTGGAEGVTAFVADHRHRVPGADDDLARALLAGGEPAAAMNVLNDLVATEPTSALGLLTCSLATGEGVELQVDLEQEAADAALRGWLRVLWGSRRADLMNAVADNVGSVVEAFPWLPDFLQEETRRLTRDA